MRNVQTITEVPTVFEHIRINVPIQGEVCEMTHFWGAPTQRCNDSTHFLLVFILMVRGRKEFGELLSKNGVVSETLEKYEVLGFSKILVSWIQFQFEHFQHNLSLLIKRHELSTIPSWRNNITQRVRRHGEFFRLFVYCYSKEVL
eukprot:GDKH01022122.1.p2 GENE.GDKH01022122.1~~GDKH01022122.1.p2  ORF type:complete len:145 (-),score=3.65 GDKH01022122.1:44-478(-)